MCGILVFLLLFVISTAAQVNITAYPSASVMLNTTLKVSCSYFSENGSLSAVATRLMVSGQRCYKGCVRAQPSCHSVSSDSVDCVSSYDSASSQLTLEYQIQHAPLSLNGREFRCIEGQHVAVLTVFIKAPPVILSMGIPDTQVIGTKTAELQCSFLAEELVRVIWYRNLSRIAYSEVLANNSAVLESGLAIQLVKSNDGNSWRSSLRITQAQPTDSASYECAVENAYGTTFSSSIQLTVLTPLSNATVSIGSGSFNDYFEDGQTVRVSCELFGGSPPFSVRLCETSVSRTTTTSCNCDRTLDSIETSDRTWQFNVTARRYHNQRAFYCDASNRATRELGTGSLCSGARPITVNFAPDNPILSLNAGEPSRVELVENEALSLRCALAAASIPAVAIRWSLNGVLLREPADGTIRESRRIDGSQFDGLLVESVLTRVVNRSDNRAELKCEAYYAGRPIAHATYSRNVTFGPAVVYIEPQGGTQAQYRVGANATFDCVASDSNPETRVTFEWRNSFGQVGYGLQPIAHDPEKWSNEHGGVTVRWSNTIFNLTEQQDGFQLTCTFQHDRTNFSRQLTAQLSVCVDPLVSVSSRTVSNRLREGDNLTLQCSVTDSQQRCRLGTPTYLWLFNGTTVMGRSSVLHLTSLLWYQLGTYHCSVAWPFSSQTFNASYLVDFLYAPQCNDCAMSRLVLVAANETLVLRASVFSKPPPRRIVWYSVQNQYDVPVISSGLPLESTFRDQLSLEVESVPSSMLTRVTITIRNFAAADQGVYRLSAEHSLSNAAWTFELRLSTPGANSSTDVPVMNAALVGSAVAVCVALAAVLVVVIVLVRRRSRRKQLAKRRNDSADGGNSAYDRLLEGKPGAVAATDFDGSKTTSCISSPAVPVSPLVYQRVLASPSSNSTDVLFNFEASNRRTELELEPVEHGVYENVVTGTPQPAGSTGISIYPPLKDPLRLFRGNDIPDEFFKRPDEDERKSRSVFVWDDLANAVVDVDKYLERTKGSGDQFEAKMEYADVHFVSSPSSRQVEQSNRSTTYDLVDFSKTAASRSIPYSDV